MVWGATCVRMAVACAHARPMVARLWKKYAARRKVNALSVGSSPLSVCRLKFVSCKKETSCRTRILGSRSANEIEVCNRAYS